MLQWPTIKCKFAITVRPKVKWIKVLETIIITPISRCLPSHLQSSPKDISDYMSASNCPDISCSSREWIAIWQPTSNSTIMGCIQKKYPMTNIIVGQHYTKWLNADTATPTPHSSLPVLIQCQGYHLDDPAILLSYNSRSTCLFTGDANLTMILD